MADTAEMPDAIARRQLQRINRFAAMRAFGLVASSTAASAGPIE
jgi:hypothetical protein